MEIDFPICALQRTESGEWLIRAPVCDPLLPSVVAVATVAELELILDQLENNDGAR